MKLTYFFHFPDYITAMEESTSRKRARDEGSEDAGPSKRPRQSVMSVTGKEGKQIVGFHPNNNHLVLNIEMLPEQLLQHLLRAGHCKLSSSQKVR